MSGHGLIRKYEIVQLQLVSRHFCWEDFVNHGQMSAILRTSESYLVSENLSYEALLKTFRPHNAQSGMSGPGLLIYFCSRSSNN